jgi:hypothetical protein
MLSDQSNQKLRRQLSAASIAVGIALFAFAPVAGAQESDGGSTVNTAVCTDVTIGMDTPMYPPFVTSSPYSVSVPAGTYRIHAVSHDLLHEDGYQPEERQESWSFSTNTGYSSPVTPDLSETSKSVTFDLGEVTFDAAVSSITFHWRGVVSDVDSVRPGLTLSCFVNAAAATTEVPTTVAPTTVAPTTEAPTTTEPAGQVMPSSTVASKSTDPDTLPRTGSSASMGWLAAAFVSVGAVFASTGRMSKELVEA